MSSVGHLWIRFEARIPLGDAIRRYVKLTTSLGLDRRRRNGLPTGASGKQRTTTRRSNFCPACSPLSNYVQHSFFEGESDVIKCKSGTAFKRLLYMIQNTIHTSSQIQCRLIRMFHLILYQILSPNRDVNFASQLIERTLSTNILTISSSVLTRHDPTAPS